MIFFHNNHILVCKHDHRSITDNLILFFYGYQIASFELYHLGVNSMPQVQLMQADPLPRQYAEAALEDGVIGGILNLELDPSAADEHI